MSSKILLRTVALVSLLCAASYFSPHYAVYRMRDAIASRNEAAFSAHVDYPALRESFKQQLAQAAAGNDAERGRNPLAALGEGMARAVGGPLVDLLLGPPGLIEMLNAGEPDITRAVMAAAISRVPAAADTAPDMTLRYRDWNTVVYRRVNAADVDGSFILRRQGWWRWRLAGVELGNVRRDQVGPK